MMNTFKFERPRTYRFTYRMEVFVQGWTADEAQRAFEAGAGEDAEYVGQVSGPEEYDEPFGTPVEGGDDV